MKYFYIENEEQKGPVNFEELIALPITEKTLIWYEGLDEWTEAKNISALEEYFKKTTPPKIPIADKEPPKYTAQTPNQSSVQTTKDENKSNSKIKYIALFSGIVLLLITVFLMSKSGESEQDLETYPEFTNNNEPTEYSDNSYTNNETENQESNYTQNQPQQKQQQTRSRQLSEEEIRQNLFNKEVSNPSNYLDADGTYRVNLVSNTIIEGTIYNSASIAGFKNVKLTAKFYSKTDVLLAKESFMVMDFVDPNGSLTFKYKISGWWDGIDHWSLSVNSAEGY